MGNKIISITETRPQETTLPDGAYHGSWAGNTILIVTPDKIYNLETEYVVKGIGVSVVVIVKDGVATFQELKN